MTNGNEEPHICVGTGEPTHDATTWDDTPRRDANGKRAYLDLCRPLDSALLAVTLNKCEPV